MIRLLFERGRFDEESTLRSARALACLAPGLVAFSVVNILARAFYALGDLKTPMRVSIFCLSVNLVLSAALVFPLREAGLGLANTVTSLINVTLLLYALRRKLKTLAVERVRETLPALVGSAVVAGGIAWGAARFWTLQIGHSNLWSKLGEVFLPMAVASAVYLGLTVWLKTGHAAELWSLVRARVRRGR
jgi:putative peptidoglycan lipid II flippase